MIVRVLAGIIAAAVVVTGGWLWWWRAYERSHVDTKRLPAQPAIIAKQADRLEALLDGAPWVSPGGKGPVLWEVGFRHCSDCIAYERLEFTALREAGVDTRVVIYAPWSGKYDASKAERDAIAELYRTRDWAFYVRWTAEAPAAFYARAAQPDSDGDPARAAAIEAGRQLRRDLEAVLKANGWDMETPSLFWKGEDGRWRTYLGHTPQGRAFVRHAMGVR